MQVIVQDLVVLKRYFVQRDASGLVRGLEEERVAPKTARLEILANRVLRPRPCVGPPPPALACSHSLPRCKAKPALLRTLTQALHTRCSQNRQSGCWSYTTTPPRQNMTHAPTWIAPAFSVPCSAGQRRPPLTWFATYGKGKLEPHTISRKVLA